MPKLRDVEMGSGKAEGRKQKAEASKPAPAFLLSAFCFLLSYVMRTERESFEILDRALTAANTEADAVFISVDQNISRFANSNLHQNMSEVSAGLTLRVIVDGSMGVASTSSFDDEEIARTAAL